MNCIDRRKKILIISHALELGGVERSLIGLLESLDPEVCNVDLFLFRHHGELLPYIPSWVNLLPEISGYTIFGRPIKDIVLEGHILLASARLCGKYAAKVFNHKSGFVDSDVPIEYSHKYTYPFLPDINKTIEYDLAISFLTPHYICEQKVNAKKKIAWIHTDYSTIQINKKSEFKMWKRYDHIVSISPSVTSSFITCFPELADKIIEIENILPAKLINRQQSELAPLAGFRKNGVNILSIGRFCYPKNFDNVPDICKRICDAGIDVFWYLIGYGPDEELIRSKIREAGMEDRVIMLGKRDNPYPYIKNCDIYVQPSRYEGKSVSVREAQYLGKPVVITEFPTSKSQVCNGINGVIIPLDNEDCASRLIELIKDRELLQRVSNNCFYFDFTNSKEIEKVYQLLN